MSLPPPASPRLVSLDVLRGIAILLMIFSGMVPKTLPNWMDHGYQPHYKPDANGTWVSALNNDGAAVFDGRWKAMTWVDLVFPMFLFSMGAAIPIAMAKRLDRGESKASLAGTIFARWLMLIAFAVLLSHLIPPAFDGQDADARRWFALCGTGVAFLFFVRWPAAMPKQAQRGVRWLSGFALVAIVLANAIQYSKLAAETGQPGLRFRWSQSDTIILVLAYTYLVAGIGWLLTSRWPVLRLMLFVPVMLFAHYLAISPTDYADWLWMGDWPLTRTLFTTHGGAWTLMNVLQSPGLVLNLPARFPPIVDAGTTRPWLPLLADLSPLFNFTWLKYLWIVVPGTMVGDWLVRRWQDVPTMQWIDPMTGEIEGDDRLIPKWTILLLAVAAIVLACVGLRNYGFTTLGLGGAMTTPYFALLFAVPVVVAIMIVAVIRVPKTEWLVRRLCVVGGLFATIGLVLACTTSSQAKNGFFEGGISKGPPATLSYYFVATGLCMQLLAGLFAVLDAAPRPPRRVGLMEANGQNPLLVYFLDHIAVSAVFGLAIFAPFHSGNPDDSWWSHVRSLDDLGRTAQPWLGAARGALKTLLIAVFVWMLTRRRIYWRA